MVIVEESVVSQVGARRAGRHAGVLVFAGYFAVLCLLGLLFAGVRGQLQWGMPVAEIAVKAGFNDPGSFITGALDIARHGWVTPADYWLVHLWPPGFMALEGALLRLMGEGVPILVPLLVLAALCSAGWMFLLRAYLLPTLPERLATAAPLVTFVFPVAPFVMFSPMGLAFGETFSISFFIAGFLLILLARRSGSWWQAIAAGIALALSAYFRSQFEVLVVVLTLAAVVLVLAYLVVFVMKRRALVDGRTLRAIVVGMTVAQAAMMPWRYHNFVEHGKFAWVETSTIIAHNSLTPEDQLLKAGARFVVEGGGHLACKLQPSYCGRTEPEFFYRAFFQHPFAWLAEKAQRLPKYWFAPAVPSSMATVGQQPSWADLLANLVLLACVAAVPWRLWRIRRQPTFAVQAWFQASFYGSLAAVYTLAHFEARYFYLPKIFAVVALLSLLPRSGGAAAFRNEVNR